MNKFLQKLAKIFLGISMAAGVGVAISAGHKDASPAQAANSTYNLVSSLTANDEVLIVAKKGSTYYYLPQSNGASSAPTASEITVSNYSITGDYDAALFKVVASSTNWQFQSVANNSNYLYINGSNNNGIRIGSSGSDKTFTVTEQDSTNHYFQMKSTSNNRYVGVYLTQDWRCYTSTGQANYGSPSSANQVMFFKKAAAKGTLDSISLNTNNVQKSFDVGDTFNYTGLVVTANYTNPTSSAAVTPTSVTPETNWNQSAGSKTVTVSYTEGGITKTATYDITVSTFNGFTKVTSAPTDWSGTYLVVYENTSSQAYVWTGVDATSCYVTATISSGKISSAPSGAVTITIASMTGGYSLKVNGGTNSGKYIYGTSGSNVLNFGTSAQLNTISFDSGVLLTSNTSVLRFNNASGNLRFRYFKSSSYSSQQVVQLYKQAGASETVTVSRTDSAKDVVYAEHSYSAEATGFTATAWSFSISDTNVATIKTQSSANGTCTITLVGTGSATLTATATKTGGTVVGTIPVGPVGVGLKSISISGQKTHYYVGDTFETKSGTVTAIFSDDSEVEQSDYSENSSAVDMSTAGEYEVIVSKTINGITRSTSFTVTVEVDTYVMTGIKIVVDANFKKTDVVAGSDWDKANVKFYKVFTNANQQSEDRLYTPTQVEGDMVTYSPAKPAANTTSLNITWAFTGFNTASETVSPITVIEGFTLIKDASQIVAGAQIYIGAADSNMLRIMNYTLDSGHFGYEEVSGGNDQTDYIIPTSDMALITVGGNSTDGFTFTTKDGAFGGSGDNLVLASSTTSNNLWTINSIDSDGEADLSTSDMTSGKSLSYNSSSPRFKVYTLSSSMYSVRIFAKIPTYLKPTDTILLVSSVDLNTAGDHEISGSVSYSENLTETLTITSSDNDVAEVKNVSHSYSSGSSTFDVQCKANGQATITVTGSQSSVSIQKILTVFTSLTDITVPSNDVSVGLNQEYDLHNVITYNPSTTTQRELAWDITDGPTNGATVSSAGIFLGTTEGTYEITVMDENMAEYTFNVVVTSPFELYSLDVTLNPGTYYHLGDSFDNSKVTITAIYKNASEQTQNVNISPSDSNLTITVPANFAQVTQTAYSIGFQYNDVTTKSTSLSITLDAITRIEVVSSTAPNTVVFGSTTADISAEVRAFTASEPSGFTANNNYVTINSINSLVLGEQNVSVSYGGQSTSISTYVTNVGTSFSVEALDVSNDVDNDYFCKSDMPANWSQVGAGNDYADQNAPYLLKMDGSGDAIICTFPDGKGTKASTIAASLYVKTLGGTSASSFTVYPLDSEGNPITSLGSFATNGTGTTQNAEVTCTASVQNNKNETVYGIKFVFVKGSNVGVSGGSVTVDASVDTNMINAQKQAMADYLAKFKTCTSGWGSRNEIENLVVEYNAMDTNAKVGFESITITDYDWTNINEYNISTHQYGSGAKSLSGVFAIQKLKDMVDYYNKSRSGSEDELVLVTPSGEFKTYASPNALLLSIIGQSTNTVAIIVIISMVSVTAIGGYFFLRKRKENI